MRPPCLTCLPVRVPRPSLNPGVGRAGILTGAPLSQPLSRQIAAPETPLRSPCSPRPGPRRGTQLTRPGRGELGAPWRSGDLPGLGCGWATRFRGDPQSSMTGKLSYLPCGSLTFLPPFLFSPAVPAACVRRVPQAEWPPLKRPRSALSPSACPPPLGPLATSPGPTPTPCSSPDL